MSFRTRKTAVCDARLLLATQLHPTRCSLLARHQHPDVLFSMVPCSEVIGFDDPCQMSLVLQSRSGDTSLIMEHAFQRALVQLLNYLYRIGREGFAYTRICKELVRVQNSDLGIFM
jgi:hypothetical protein